MALKINSILIISAFILSACSNNGSNCLKSEIITTDDADSQVSCISAAIEDSIILKANSQEATSNSLQKMQQEYESQIVDSVQKIGSAKSADETAKAFDSGVEGLDKIFRKYYGVDFNKLRTVKFKNEEIHSFFYKKSAAELGEFVTLIAILQNESGYVRLLGPLHREINNAYRELAIYKNSKYREYFGGKDSIQKIEDRIVYLTVLASTVTETPLLADDKKLHAFLGQWRDQFFKVRASLQAVCEGGTHIDTLYPSNDYYPYKVAAPILSKGLPSFSEQYCFSGKAGLSDKWKLAENAAIELQKYEDTALTISTAATEALKKMKQNPELDREFSDKNIHNLSTILLTYSDTDKKYIVKPF